MSLGSRIRQLRCRAGLSQKEVAKKSDITVSFLSQVERDIATPSLKSLRNIALAIGARVSYLLGEDTATSKKIELVKRNTNERIVLGNGDSIYLKISNG
jgi:transcriptional regulator with XRE-family HTH domain